MARIAGVNIPTNKRVEIALTYIHGIGRTTAKGIIAKLGIAPPAISISACAPLARTLMTKTWWTRFSCTRRSIMA